MRSALRLFCALGFQQTSTTKITKDAGVGTGTLFLYFKSKDELVNTLYLEIKKEMQVHHQVFADKSLAFREQLNIFWHGVVGWGLTNPNKFKFMMQFKNSPYLSQLTIEEVAEEHQFVKEVIAQAINEGLIINQPFDYLMTLFSSQFSAIIQYLDTSSMGRSDKLIQTSFEVLWNGIKKIQHV